MIDKKEEHIKAQGGLLRPKEEQGRGREEEGSQDRERGCKGEQWAGWLLGKCSDTGTSIY